MRGPAVTPTLSDPALSSTLSDLEVQLQHRLRGYVRELRLLHQSQGLVLQGYSATYYAKQLAQHALMKATSLPLLSNEIRVI